MHQHASLESDPDNGHLAKEAARKQWLKELDEQRRQSQLAKKKDSSERKEPVLVYSSLFEPKRNPACPAAPRLEAPTPTSFFTGGTQNSLVTTHASSNSNNSSNKDAGFGRRRSQFRDAESSDALRRNDEWRRALQAQIDAKKRRDAEERSQLNQLSQQHPHSFESITGCPRRRSALADAGGGGGGGVYDSFAGFGAQTPAKAAAAPAAEYAELKSPLPPAASKIPRPNLPPRTQKPPPSPLPVIENQQEIHESSPRESQHDFSPDHQKHQNSHQQRRRSPSPPQNSPPANQRIQNFPPSPTKKLSKILGSVKGGHGYPLSENEQGVLQGGTKKKGAVIVKPNAKPRVKSAFGRTLPPPSNPPEQQKQQQKKTSNQLNALNHNKKLPAIIRGGGIVDAGPYPKHAKQQSISKSSSRIVEVEPVAVIPGSKFQQLQARIHQKVREERSHQQQQQQHVHQDVERHEQQQQDDMKRDRTVRRDPPREPQQPSAPSVNHLVPAKQTKQQPAAGTSTGRSFSRAEFSPQGTLRTPWGTDITEAVSAAAGSVRINGKVEKAGRKDVIKPPWGTEDDVPVRVLGRERRPQAKKDAVDEQVLRAEALNELTRFGSMLAEEQRVLRMAMGGRE